MKSNIEWKMWGKSDPLYGVATWAGKDKAGESPWTDKEFYELGLSDWKDFSRRWQRYGRDDGTCVEIGCGAGRLTMHLANDFAKVFAIDVSEGMLEYARKRINLQNVEFQLSDGVRIDQPSNSVDAVFSAHVFQHLDSIEQGATYFAEIARCLATNGTLMVHLPTFAWPYGATPAIQKLVAARQSLSKMSAAVRRWRIQRGEFVPLMRGISYPQSFFYDLFPRLGLAEIELLTFATSSNGDPHNFVFARKLPS
jgi:SAM-dependent methyltransferase